MMLGAFMSNSRRGPAALQYVSLLGLIGLIGLGAFRPVDIPAWAIIGLVAIAIGANPKQLTEWLGVFKINVTRRNGGNDKNGDS